MPYFLTQNDLYRLQQRELPVDVYPDSGNPAAFYSTADSDATAIVFAEAYENLSDIYDNYFPNYATDRLPDFELLYLGQQLGSDLTVQQRQDRVLAKIRSQRRTTEADILATVYTVIDSSIQVEIVPWGCGCAGWVLDVSQLGISTQLNYYNGLEVVGSNLCTLDAEGFGLPASGYALLQKQAYFYEVRIYNYTLTPLEAQQLETALLAAEPARSQHLVIDGADPNDMIGESC